MEEQAPWYQNKVLLWSLGALLALLTSVAGYLGNRVHTLSSTETQLRQERDAAVAVSKTASAQVAKLTERVSTTESKYRKLVLAKNPITGEALFDKEGHPIFDTEDGSSNEVTQLREQLSSTAQAYERLEEKYHMATLALENVKVEVTRPARSAWSYGLGYSAPLSNWLNVQGPSAKVWGGTGYHLPLLGQEAAIMAQIGVPPLNPSGTEGKVFLDLRP